MDVQGFELSVLQGAESVIHSFDYIISEVETEELYEKAALFPELTEWLRARNFQLVDSVWEASTWGDALFRNQSAASNRSWPERFSWREFQRRSGFGRCATGALAEMELGAEGARLNA